ncbi:MAG: S49 family peptidase, partial [Clostridia bacterium]|nr:S49 family peptidase [Clostridia bacterium]
MPSWHEILKEIQNNHGEVDTIRRKYLKKVSDISGRNTIAYYSGFLQKPGIQQSAINDNDKNGFMATIHKLDRSKGLDIILHTEGGGIAAAESLVD